MSTPITSGFLVHMASILDDCLPRRGEARQRFQQIQQTHPVTAGAGGADDEARQLILADWLLRVGAPAWLAPLGADNLEVADLVRALRSAEPISTWAAYEAAEKGIGEAARAVRRLESGPENYPAWQAADGRVNLMRRLEFAVNENSSHEPTAHAVQAATYAAYIIAARATAGYEDYQLAVQSAADVLAGRAAEIEEHLVDLYEALIGGWPISMGHPALFEPLAQHLVQPPPPARKIRELVAGNPRRAKAVWERDLAKPDDDSHNWYQQAVEATRGMVASVAGEAGQVDLGPVLAAWDTSKWFSIRPEDQDLSGPELIYGLAGLGRGLLRRLSAGVRSVRNRRDGNIHVHVHVGGDGNVTVTGWSLEGHWSFRAWYLQAVLRPEGDEHGEITWECVEPVQLAVRGQGGATVFTDEDRGAAERNHGDRFEKPRRGQPLAEVAVDWYLAWAGRRAARELLGWPQPDLPAEPLSLEEFMRVSRDHRDERKAEEKETEDLDA